MNDKFRVCLWKCMQEEAQVWRRPVSLLSVWYERDSQLAGVPLTCLSQTLCMLAVCANGDWKPHRKVPFSWVFRQALLIWWTLSMLYFCKHNIKGTLWSLERYISVMCQVSKNCWYCLEWPQWFIKMTKWVILSMIYESHFRHWVS